MGLIIANRLQWGHIQIDFTENYIGIVSIPEEIICHVLGQLSGSNSSRVALGRHDGRVRSDRAIAPCIQRPPPVLLVLGGGNKARVEVVRHVDADGVPGKEAAGQVAAQVDVLEERVVGAQVADRVAVEGLVLRQDVVVHVLEVGRVRVFRVRKDGVYGVAQLLLVVQLSDEPDECVVCREAAGNGSLRVPC